MGKVNNALTMLMLLRNKQKMTRKELAQELEVDVRQISRYKDDLCAAGIWINEERGRYGGYSINRSPFINGIELTKGEIKALEYAVDHVKAGPYPLKEEFSRAILKIISSDKNKRVLAKKSRKMIKGKDITFKKPYKERWVTINENINKCKKLKIEYVNYLGETSVRVVRPYDLCSHEKANYMIAYCECKKKVMIFKLMRIKKIESLDEEFKIEDYDLKKYLENKIGMDNDCTEYKVKLKIRYPEANKFKENKWVLKEEIIDYKNNGYIIYKGLIQGKNDIVKWIMKMGSAVTVLEPEEIRQAVVDECNNIINQNTI